MKNKDCAAGYLGVLVGIVGSIDTRAPSGSIIITAVFLQKKPRKFTAT